jgi:hypothetical protein
VLAAGSSGGQFQRGVAGMHGESRLRVRGLRGRLAHRTLRAVAGVP